MSVTYQCLPTIGQHTDQHNHVVIVELHVCLGVYSVCVCMLCDNYCNIYYCCTSEKMK